MSNVIKIIIAGVVIVAVTGLGLKTFKKIKYEKSIQQNGVTIKTPTTNQPTTIIEGVTDLDKDLVATESMTQDANGEIEDGLNQVSQTDEERVASMDQNMEASLADLSANIEDSSDESKKTDALNVGADLIQ